MSYSYGTTQTNPSANASASNSVLLNSGANQWSQELSMMLAALGQYQYKWAQQQFNNGMVVTGQNIDQLLAASKTALGFANNLLGRYQNVFEPVMNRYLQQAADYSTPERQAVMAGRAESLVGQADQAAMDSAQRQLMEAGVNVNSGRFQDLLLAQRTADAAARAGAGNEAAMRVGDIGRQMTLQGAQLGQNVPGMTVNAINAGYQGINSAQQALTSMLNTGANLTNSAANFFNPAVGAAAAARPQVGQQTRSAGGGGGGGGKQQSQPAQQQQGGRGGGGGGARPAPTAGVAKVVNNPYTTKQSNQDQTGEMQGPPDPGYETSGYQPEGGIDFTGMGLFDQSTPETEGYNPEGGIDFTGMGLFAPVPGLTGDPNIPLDPNAPNTGSDAASLSSGMGPSSESVMGGISPAAQNLAPAAQDMGGGLQQGFQQGPMFDQGGGGTQGAVGQSSFDWQPQQVGGAGAGFAGFGGTSALDTGPAPQSDFSWAPQQPPVADVGAIGAAGAGAGFPSQDFGGGSSADVSNYDTNYFNQPGTYTSQGYNPPGGIDFSGFGPLFDTNNPSYTPPSDASSQSESSSGLDSFGGGGGYGYSSGGRIRSRPTTGGNVPRSASPSRGRQTDDIPARLNAGEFVVPRDVVAHKGSEFFHKLIEQSRRRRTGMAGPPAQPTQKPALRLRPSFVSRQAG